MARPPVVPLKDGKDYFERLIDLVSKYFELKDIQLNFDGYKKTVEEYYQLDLNNYNDCWNMSRDFNMWGEYFSNLKALTEKLFLDSETEKKRTYATASIAEDTKKVANGDRLANKNADVVKIRSDRNMLKAFLTALDSKIDFCYKCHHHCKATCNWLNPRDNNTFFTS